MARLPLLFIIPILLLSACVKAPEQTVAPSVKIDRVESEGKIVYSAMITSGMRNDNPEKALVNVKGSLLISDAQGPVVSMPFSLPVILPFTTERIEDKVSLDEAQAKRLAVIIKKDFSELEKKGNVISLFISEEALKIEDLTWSSKGIVSLLKSKMESKKQHE
jgi:hypothetical protein